MPQSNSLAAPIAQGRTAEVYDWDAHHVLKLYYAWCPPGWAEHEAHVACAVAKAGIPTPAVSEVVEVNGRRGVIYERVIGVSMLDDMRRRPWRLLDYARALADLQAQFHRLSIPGLHSYRHSLERSIRRAPHLPAVLRERALALLETLPDGGALCHGDFHPDNVLITRRGSVVIDWLTACLGDPWADVARTSLIVTIGVRSAGKKISPTLRLLTGLFHRTYLNRYQSLVSVGQADLARWQPVIAAARLNEQIEPEREALLQILEEGDLR